MPDYTILVIDYDPRSVDALRRPLQRAGYRVETAPDGLAGIARFKTLEPDLTLIEAMIPKKHGFEVCQELKKTPHGQRSAIWIITSVYKGRKYRTQATHYHRCDAYIEKPISDELLLERVGHYFASVESRRPPRREDQPDGVEPGGSDMAPQASPVDSPVEDGTAAENESNQGGFRDSSEAGGGVVVTFDPGRGRPPETASPQARSHAPVTADAGRGGPRLAVASRPEHSEAPPAGMAALGTHPLHEPTRDASGETPPSTGGRGHPYRWLALALLLLLCAFLAVVAFI